MKILDPVSFTIRKESILQHARHLFATKGYSETSMDDIAHTCGLQKASLYHYFESKQKLLQDLVDLHGARWSARIKDYESGQSFEETLHTIATTFLKDMDDAEPREFFTLIHFESHKNPAILKALKESPTHNRNGFYGVFAKYLDGRLPRNKIAIFITQFMGALIHYASATKLRSENICPEKFEEIEFINQLTQTFAKGIL